jgi:hypothetical protein
MSLLDFSLPLNRILYDSHHILQGVTFYPDEMKMEVFRELIKCRHNALHYFCHRMMEIDWCDEKKISEVIPYDFPKKYANKTPDTIHQHNGVYWLIDYSIGIDIYRASDKKEKKYTPIVELLQKEEIPAVFVHINVKADFSNLELELQKIDLLQKNEFEHSYFVELCNTLDEQKNILGRMIEPQKMEEMKKGYYGDIEDEEFEETTVGFYQDLDVDLGGFKKYNSSFNHEKIIEEAILHTPTSVLEDELKSILENNDDIIHKKYMDKKLTVEQFDRAYEEILDRNRSSPHRNAKPSHHMLIPLPDDIKMTGDQLSEQDSIINFAQDFVQFYEQQKKSVEHHRLCYLSALFKTILNCTTGEDKKVYKALFEGRGNDYIELVRDFRELKISRGFHNLFHTKGKAVKDFRKITRGMKPDDIVLPANLPHVRLKQKEINKLGINIDKHDTQSLWLYYQNCLNILNKYKGVTSVTDFLYHTNVLKHDPKEHTSTIIGSKKLKMSKEKQPQLVKVAMEKAGIKSDVEAKNRTPKQDRGTIPIESRRTMDNLLQYMAKGNHDPSEYRNYEYLTTSPSRIDSPDSFRLKEESIFDYQHFLDKIMCTNAYKYSYFIQQAYNQLFHYNEHQSSNDTVVTFNMGIDNFCCVVVLTKTKREGNPFICVLKTETPDRYTDFWGKLNKIQIPNTNQWYVYKSWRRLDKKKVTYLRDVHYSVLSSTMNSAMSDPMAVKFAIGTKIKELYSFRVLIALSANQKTSELLLDTRYAYMSAISWYTDLGKLLVDKYGYQFNTVIESWIIWRVITKLKEINNASNSGGITNFRITLDGRMRDIHTIGGKIRMPGLWMNYELTDITELLDEAFVYVHTIKEPANIYHEQVKAVQTIVKFQNEYNNSPKFVQTGSITTVEEMRNFLLRDGYVGCCAPIIYESTCQTIQKENPNFKKYVHEINNESIGELLSTKAVIADEDREVVKDTPINKREMKKLIKRHEAVVGFMAPQEKIEHVKYRLKVSSRFYNDYKPRQRVWETILEYLEKDNKMTNTVHLANYFLKNPIVCADICIKSQYGSKREFYVINITAKALARLTENFFRKLSENSPNEAISISGDRKVMTMQSMLDNVHALHKDETHDIIYTNGDCTKWSAAETMQSFIAMTCALKEKISEGMYQVLLATFNSWTKKKIHVPMDIYNKVVPCEEHNTNYLEEMRNNHLPYMDSTQNFLQGMFNYSSSYKAVCCSNYTYSLWRRFYPESNLKVEHLEHSDDYVTVCMYSDLVEFEKYRLLHKMVMRLHGYSDSERKTCSQPYIMEFVSQMSHNGVMLYPQIKKSKEVNLSLPCTGYTKDMEAAMSRVGECARVGCNLSFLYFFQRLHAMVVADAYSVLPGMCNNMGRTYEQLLSEPVELFGIPDPNPIFSLYCRGNINNYRLYEEGDEYLQRKIRFLYDKSISVTQAEGVVVEQEDDRYSLATPRFLYDMGNKTLSRLKQNINVQMNDVQDLVETPYLQNSKTTFQ